MGTKVTAKREQRIVPDPAGRSPDPWADFREVEILDLEWTQRYKHSLGKYSRFFLALEEGRFLATRCERCEKTWSPPRPACPHCLQPTKWVALSGRGELVSWSVLHYAPKMLADVLMTPYVLAYVRPEGADTLFAHLLDGADSDEGLRAGLPVHVVYNEGPVDHPILLMRFARSE